MSKKARKQTEGDRNPYQKVYDDAKRTLNETGDFDYLKEIPSSNDREVANIPFPYGGRKTSAYNCN